MNDTRLNALLGTAVTAMAIMSSGSVALAQDAKTVPAARTANEIVITARKIEESMQDIPGALPFGVDYVPTLGNRRRVGATLTFDY